MSSEPIRVLHVISSLGVGGAQICVKYIVESCSPEIENYVYPLRSKPEDIHIDGEIIEIPYSNYDPRKFLALVKLCRNHNIDILHAHLSKPIIGCLLASFFCKAKVVVHEHGPVFRRAAAFPGYRLLLRILKKRAEVFIAVSRVTAEKLQKTFGIPSDRIQVIYNAVDTAAFDPEKYTPNEVRQSLGIDEDVTVLGFAGRLSDQKGVDLIIRSLSLLKDRSKKYLLLIVGDGPRRKSLEQLACELAVEKSIRFLGFCQNVPQVMSAFDIGLVPSRFEPFGIVAIEFMRMKIPIVTSAVDGLKEILENKKNCLMTEQNTPEQICSCVNRLMEDNGLRGRLVEHAFHDADRFSIHKQLFDIEALYKKIISQANKAAVDLSR